MSTAQTFNGFSKEAIKFYEKLIENNDKFWFENHRKIFDNNVMKPAQAFVVELGERLECIARRSRRSKLTTKTPSGQSPQR